MTVFTLVRFFGQYIKRVLTAVITWYIIGLSNICFINHRREKIMTKEERMKFEKRLAHKIYILQHPELWEKIRAEKERKRKELLKAALS